MKTLFAILAALPLVAAAQQLGDLRAGTNVTVVSDIHYEPRWDRTFVRETPEGIRGDKGRVGSAAADQAVGEFADQASEVSDAALGAITNAMQKVYAVTNLLPQHAYGISFHIAPPQTEGDLRGYVVKTTSDGYTDTQYVWYSQRLTRPLQRYVTYTLAGGGLSNDVACVWQNPFTNTVTVTEGGVTWTGCHVCTVPRPTWACGLPAVDKNPNEVFGGGEGFDFGDMPVFVDGRPTLTKTVTNKLNSALWIRFDNGVMKEKSWE